MPPGVISWPVRRTTVSSFQIKHIVSQFVFILSYRVNFYEFSLELIMYPLDVVFIGFEMLDEKEKQQSLTTDGIHPVVL